MKLALCALFMCLAVPAFAVEKNCNWVGGTGSSGSKGDKVTISVTKKSIKVSKSTGDGAWPGNYKRGKDVVHGEDKKTYLDFAARGEEGCTSVLVNQDLTTEEGKGLIKFRCRGEGFMEDKFFCHNGSDDEDEKDE